LNKVRNASFAWEESYWRGICLEEEFDHDRYVTVTEPTSSPDVRLRVRVWVRVWVRVTTSSPDVRLIPERGKRAISF